MFTVLQTGCQTFLDMFVQKCLATHVARHFWTIMSKNVWQTCSRLVPGSFARTLGHRTGYVQRLRSSNSIFCRSVKVWRELHLDKVQRGLRHLAPMALIGLALQAEGPLFVGSWTGAFGVGIIHLVWSVLLGFVLLLVALRYGPRLADTRTDCGETERLREEVNRLRRELQAVCASCATAEQEVDRLRSGRRTISNRTVQCQSMVTYTALRGVATPRFEPLREVCAGAWVQ